MTREDPRALAVREVVQGTCPQCGQETTLRKGTTRETILIRNAPIEIEAEVRRCDNCGEVFAAVDEEERNFQRAYRVYRDRHGLLQPEEIRGIRNQYGVSQRAFSRLLGWGEITLHRYEAGALQDKAHNNELLLLRDPQNFKILFERQEQRLPSKLRARVRARLDNLLGSSEKIAVGTLKDLFVSHSSADKPIARKLVADVESHEGANGRQLTVWLDEAQIDPGESIPGAISAGLETSRFFALLLSPAYFESRSGWTDAEWHAMLHTDPDNRRGRILPVLISDCPRIPPLLRHLRIIDMRGSRYGDGLNELLDILRGEPQAKPAIYKGQLIVAGRVAREALVAERTVFDAEPAAVTEYLSCNLLPVERLPMFVYTAPVAESLRVPRPGASKGLPSKAAIKDAIRAAQEEVGRRPFMPAFRLLGEDIVTFHDLESDDGSLSPVIKGGQARRERTDAWLSHPEERKVITSLMNMAVSRHAYRLGLREDGEKPHRYLFPPKDGSSRSVNWKPFRKTASREVVGLRRSPMGEFWRHAAAYLTMTFLGNRFYLKIDPTWVFTIDGQHIMRGPEVGKLAIHWTGVERNLSLLYHIRFWSHLLRNGLGPVFSIRAGDQSMEVSAQPAFVRMAFGILGDGRDLDHGLDTSVEEIEFIEEQALEAALERQLSRGLESIEGEASQVLESRADLDDE